MALKKSSGKEYKVVSKPSGSKLIIPYGTYLTQYQPQKGSNRPIKNVIIR